MYHLYYLCESFFDYLLDLSSDTRCIGMARVGSTAQTIAVSTLTDINAWDMGEPLHSLVIVGDTHPLEDKMLSIVSNAEKKLN